MSVRGCGLVGDPGLLALARGCPALQHLNIRDCEFSPRALALIAASLNNCYIETSLCSQYWLESNKQ